MVASFNSQFVVRNSSLLYSVVLRGAAPIVGYRGDVPDRFHLQAGGLERPDRGFTSGSGSLQADLKSRIPYSLTSFAASDAAC